MLPNTITISASISEALKSINDSDKRICLVTEPDGRLARVITDGDIRRALLSGVSTEDAISVLPPTNPVTCRADVTESDMLSLMADNDIDIVVVVNQENHPLSLVNRSMLEPNVLLSPPHMGEREQLYVGDAFEENWVAPAGPHLAKFEHGLEAITGLKSALAVSSGTAALHLAMRVLNVKGGDRVYVSDLTFAASAQPILYQNAVPVLIDSEPGTWNMSPEALARKLEKDNALGILPAAIIVVHIYGQSACMDRICEFANIYDIPVVEDAAESLGATYNNSSSGSLGTLAAFSFNGNKIITTGGGGALVSNNQELIDLARNLSTQGRDNALHYQHDKVAYNYRMSNILAGIGRGQLALLGERVEARRRIFDRYKKGLKDIPGVNFQDNSPNSLGNRWLTVVDIDPDEIGLHSYQVIKKMGEYGIECRPAWKPMHMQPLFRDYEIEFHDEHKYVAGEHFIRSFCLPSGSSMTENAQDRIISQLHKTLKRLA